MSTTTKRPTIAERAKAKREALAQRIVAVNLNPSAAAFLQGVISAKIDSLYRPLPIRVATDLVEAFERAASYGNEKNSSPAA